MILIRYNRVPKKVQKEKKTHKNVDMNIELTQFLNFYAECNSRPVNMNLKFNTID